MLPQHSIILMQGTDDVAGGGGDEQAHGAKE